MNLNSKINKIYNELKENEENLLINEFEKMWSHLNESKKSHIISILLGKGLIKKEKDGKLTKIDNEKFKSTLNKSGINVK